MSNLLISSGRGGGSGNTTAYSINSVFLLSKKEKKKPNNGGSCQPSACSASHSLWFSQLESPTPSLIAWVFFRHESFKNYPRVLFRWKVVVVDVHCQCHTRCCRCCWESNYIPKYYFFSYCYFFLFFYWLLSTLLMTMSLTDGGCYLSVLVRKFSKVKKSQRKLLKRKIFISNVHLFFYIYIYI